MNAIFRDLRKFFWHLRKGGTRQAKKYLQRRSAESSFGGTVSSSSNEALRNLLSRLAPAHFHPPLGNYTPLKWNGPLSEIGIGLVADPFSVTAWEHEFNVTNINATSLPTSETISKWSFILVEAAWTGAESSWKGKLTGEVSPEFSELQRRARRADVPIVFWNKEDPPHHEDFLPTALQCDFIFTTAAELVPKYSNHLGRDRVGVLQFAASVPLHNPVRWSSSPKREGVAFAGTFYNEKFNERRRALTMLLRGASKATINRGTPLIIYSRHYGKDPRYQFPAEFRSYVRPSLPYREMLTAYRKHKIFLNADSVVNSSTMMSRRVWELIACGTAVVGSGTMASTIFEGRGLFTATSEKTTEHLVELLLNSPALIDRSVHRGQRLIWENHTYTIRGRQILAKIGKGSPLHSGAPLVSIIAPTNRPAQLDHLIGQVRKQTWGQFELMLCTHNFRLDAAQQNRIVRILQENPGFKALTVIEGTKDDSLGRILNKLTHQARGEIMCRFDDDDFYLENYIRDQVNTLNWTQADVVGKACTFVYLRDKEWLVCRRPQFEHHWTHSVSGATLTFRSSVLNFVRFPDSHSGEDTLFLRDAVKAGLRIYSADRFNYITVRDSEHTWEISDYEIASDGVVIDFGLNLSQVTA